MTEDWTDCDNDGVALCETAGKTKLSSRICNGLIILHTIGAFSYVIGILLADVDVTDRTVELPLMMKMEYPFVIDTQRKYSLVLVTQFVFVMVCSWGAGLFNALFLTLTLHVGSQINILLCWLSKLESKDIENKHDSFVTVTTKIIRKHQKVINLSENVENLYTYIALLQFTSNIVMICSLAFLIVTAIGSPDSTEQILRSLLFYALTNLEAFIFCFAGEYLNNKSKAIGNAAYNSTWYDMKTKDSRVLLFIILRSQRQLKLTAGKMTVLSFEAYWIIALVIDDICHCRYLLMHLHSKDIFDLMDCFSSFLTQIKLTTKLIIFWLNERRIIKLIIRRKFFEILTIMAEDWNDCASSNINMRETACKAKLADRITNAMFTLHTLTIVAYSIGVLLADVDVTEQSELPLLLKVELPVNINTKRMYKMLLTMQFVHLIMSGCGTGLLNALLLTLTLHVGGQMDILRCWLSELVPRKNEGSETVAVTTNRIIRKHQRIINFSEYIEDLYTYIALVQFTSNTVLICSLGFLIVTASENINPDATEHIVRSLLFYTVTNLEAFIFCYAGEYIKNKSKAIGNAAYNSAWYEMKPKNSRNLIFVILRAQKQLTLTVGKIMDLSLESFTITLFCHYRYFLTHVHSAEILDLMDCLSSFLAYSKIIIKFLVFWLNERKFDEILTVMAEDWNDCANSDISIRETTRKAKISDRITNAIITLHTTTVVAYCIGIILADVDVTDTTKELPLVNKIEIPFDINTQFRYRTVLITEFLLMILCGWAAGITNSLLLTLILHTAGQIEIMRHWLMQLVPRKNEDKHKSAIGSPNAVEQIMKSILFYTITNLEAFIFCYAGEYLNNKSKEIGVAAYNCEWYDLKSTESRILLFIILRSQKQLTLTVGKMMDLSLQAFTSVRFI
ncbi:Putative odorant receptor 92a [Trachymyrmex cornetzi]|uniref:Putative odorant receptor 92a n=1 Tax=Trachymyrmex cornetzi TaxID=471704 RepID=A0A195E0P2_9HYME|nr:Putative odorant receptor 92a [Trachymyrmex cornetzi]